MLWHCLTLGSMSYILSFQDVWRPLLCICQYSFTNNVFILDLWPIWNTKKQKPQPKLFTLSSHSVWIADRQTDVNNHKHNTEDCRAVSRVRGQSSDRLRRGIAQSVGTFQITEVVPRPRWADAPHATTYRLLLLLSCGETEEEREERLRTDMHADGRVDAKGTKTVA